MVVYICDICGQKFNKKSVYIYHTQTRKTPCIQNTDIDCDIPSKDINLLQCEFCDKILSRYDALKKHKMICKKKKTIDKTHTVKNKNVNKSLIDTNKLLENRNKLLEEELKELKGMLKNFIENNKANTNTNIDNSINSHNNTTNNVVNNIIIKFGEEDLALIDEKYIKNAIYTGSQAVNEIIKSIHFNPEYPQFHNVYASDWNRPHCTIHDGEKWIMSDKKVVIDKLFDKGRDLLDDNVDKYEDDLPRNKKRGVHLVIDMDDTDESNNCVNNSKKEIGNIIYNERYKVTGKNS